MAFDDHVWLAEAIGDSYETVAMYQGVKALHVIALTGHADRMTGPAERIESKTNNSACGSEVMLGVVTKVTNQEEVGIPLDYRCSSLACLVA